MPDDESHPSQPIARASFEILVRAFGECLQQGRFESAREILESARHQADSAKRLEQIEGLAALLEERHAQREAGILASVSAIERALATGERMKADRLLFQAGEEYGEHPELARLHRYLEVIHRQDYVADVRDLVEQADRLSRDGRDSEAQELLIKAKALASPDDGDLQGRLLEVEKKADERVEDHRRERFEAAGQQITERLVALDYPGARAVLQALVGSLGKVEGLRDLQNHLINTHQEVLNTRVRDAGLAYEQGRFGEACRHLRSALVLSPENSWLQERLSKAEAQLAEQEMHRRQDPAWQMTLEAIEDHLSAGELGAARGAIDEAEKRWGVGAKLDALRDQLGGKRREFFTDLLRSAREDRAAGRLPSARERVEQALALCPGDEEALHLMELIERSALPEELPPTPPELAEEVTEIERLRSRGAILPAWKRIQGAIVEYGDREPLSTLRRLIADEMLAGNGP